MEALSRIKYVVNQAENIWSGAVREDGGGGVRVSAEALLWNANSDIDLIDFDTNKDGLSKNLESSRQST